MGLDGNIEFCHMAKQHTQCEVLHQQFLDLKLSASSFDGIFANACLFHVPSQELPHVLIKLHATLMKEGILFISNPRGNQEGWNGQRYGHYMELNHTRLI